MSSVNVVLPNAIGTLPMCTVAPNAGHIQQSQPFTEYGDRSQVLANDLERRTGQEQPLVPSGISWAWESGHYSEIQWPTRQ